MPKKLITSPQGFTLPELVVGICLVTLLTLMSIGVVIGAQQLMPGRAISLNGDLLPVAPSPAAFADAVRLHRVFMERLRGARATYVLGGAQQGLAAIASRCSGKALALKACPVIDPSLAGLPADSYAFYQAYQPQLGNFDDAADSLKDFSVVVVGADSGKLQVTALIQVRSSEATWKDGSAAFAFCKRSVQLYDLSGDTYSYSFLEKEGLAAESGVGARHFWYRYLEGAVAEEGPATVVFPDPWMYAGEAGRVPLPAFSRFIYCLPISS